MAKQKHSLYRPHPRVQFTGEVVDPKTGELVVLPSLTKQEFVAECDINNVLKQYKQTGMVSHMSAKAAAGSYQDLPDSFEYQDAANTVINAQRAFDSLPSKIRERFHNDPSEFLAFTADPDNADELVKLGLVKAPPPTASDPAPDPVEKPPPQ